LNIDSLWKSGDSLVEKMIWKYPIEGLWIVLEALLYPKRCFR